MRYIDGGKCLARGCQDVQLSYCVHQNFTYFSRIECAINEPGEAYADDIRKSHENTCTLAVHPLLAIGNWRRTRTTRSQEQVYRTDLPTSPRLMQRMANHGDCIWRSWKMIAPPLGLSSFVGLTVRRLPASQTLVGQGEWSTTESFPYDLPFETIFPSLAFDFPPRLPRSLVIRQVAGSGAEEKSACATRSRLGLPIQLGHSTVLYQKLVEVKGDKSKMALSVSIDNGYSKDMDLCPIIATK